MNDIHFEAYLTVGGRKHVAGASHDILFRKSWKEVLSPSILGDVLNRSKRLLTNQDPNKDTIILYHEYIQENNVVIWGGHISCEDPDYFSLLERDGWIPDLEAFKHHGLRLTPIVENAS